jgi:hypothetical protein
MIRLFLVLSLFVASFGFANAKTKNKCVVVDAMCLGC